MKWISISIPARLAGEIDKLVKSGEYSSRAEFAKEAIRTMLLSRGLLKAVENGDPEEVAA